LSRTCGWVGKILWVDLSDRTIRTLNTLDYGPAYIGGRGIAARIAWESIPPGVGALDPGSPLVVMTGPLTGTSAPESGRTIVVGLSPQGWPREWLSRSNIGGHWGPSLKYAGYDGLVIQGKAEQPVVLCIDDGKISFLDACHLWGKGAIETQTALLSDLGPSARVLAIGQSGERLSRIASIITGTNSAAGQGGYGAVMGSKNLKGIAVRGSGPVHIAQPDLFMHRCSAILDAARSGHLYRGAELDPERVQKYRQRWQACTQNCGFPCGAGCRFYGAVPGPATGQDLAGQIKCVSYRFQGTSSFYNWGLGFEGAFEARHLADDYGLNQWDLLAGIVPWLRLCVDAGLVDQVNGRPIDFHDPSFWAHFLRAIAYREGMGDALAEGGKRAPSILGFGEEQANLFYPAWGHAAHCDGHGDRGNTIFYPFWLVTALLWALDTRDPISSSHGYPALTMGWSPFGSGTDYSWDTIKAVGRRIYGTEKAVDPESGYEDKEFPAFWHAHRSVLKDSVPVHDHLFPMIMSYESPDGLARAGDMVGLDFEHHLLAAATGLFVTPDELDLACERVYNLERAVQVRNFGRSREDDEGIIPYLETEEWWQNPLLGQKMRLERPKFLALLDRYYQVRGWDIQTGRPTGPTLRRLGLHDVACELEKLGQKMPETTRREQLSCAE